MSEVAVHGGTLIRKPESLSWAQAAALPAAWVTGQSTHTLRSRASMRMRMLRA